MEPVPVFIQPHQLEHCQRRTRNTEGETLPLDVSWTPDFFGKIRSQVRESQYAAQVSAADLEVERLLEEATLAETYFEIRGQDELQRVLNGTVEADKKALEPNQTQYDTGIGNYISVVQARTTLQTAQSQALNVGVSRAQYEHAIAVVLGQTGHRFFDPGNTSSYYAAAGSDRRSIAASRTSPRCCRRGAHNR